MRRLSPHSPLRKERFSARKDASSSGPQRTLHLRYRATMVGMTDLVKGARNLIETRRTRSAVHADSHRSFGDALDPYMFVWVGQKAGQICIQDGHEKSIRTLRLPPNYPKTVIL